MNSKTLFKITILTAAIGLGTIVSVILSGTAYPDRFFRIVVPFGLAFVFISVILGAISWICCLTDTVKRKQYRWAISIFVLGLIVIVKAVIRAFF